MLDATTGLLPDVPATVASAAPLQVQRSGKAASAHVGAAMAALATLEQAGVLPPDGTVEANRIVKSVIQLQSLFAKTTDPSVLEFLQRAVAAKQGERTAEALARFQASGWTPEVLDALADETLRSPAEELQRLAPGLRSVNLSVDDFRSFMQLVRNGARALAEAGKNFRDVFAFHRTTMPGAADNTQ